jgi:hypothetical protein
VVGGEVRARARGRVVSLGPLGRGGLGKMGMPLLGSGWHRGRGRWLALAIAVTVGINRSGPE